jgi:peptide/nickel transport system substrate-binding protein
MKKWLAIPLILIVAITFVLASCGSSTTTTAPSTTATTQTTTTTSALPTTTIGTSTATATATSTAVREKPWGTIVCALNDFGTEAMDPDIYTSGFGWSMFDPLINTDDDGTYIPWVAKSWDVSADGKTWTFHIRDDIKFWNGDPLTSADVMWSVQHFTSNESQSAWSPRLRQNCASISAPDDYTFVFVTNTPELPLTSAFAATDILPMKYYTTVGADGFRKAPMATGAWKFVSHVAQTNCIFEANEDYFIKENVPAFKYVKEILVPSEATQIAMFKNGEVDMPLGITVSSRVKLQKQGYRLQVVGINAPIVLNIQGSYVDGVATNSMNIRLAMSYAINRQEICDTIYEGQATPGGQFCCQPGGFGVTDDIVALGADAYDPAKAKQLIKDANYPAAFTKPLITIYTSAGPSVDMLTAVVAYWKAVGLQAEVKTLDTTVVWAYWFDTGVVGPLTIKNANAGWLWLWTFGVADSTYYQGNMQCSYGVHRTLNDPAMDKMYADYLANTDSTKSFTMFNEFLKAGFAHRACIGICMTLPYIVISDKLGTFTKHLTQYYAMAFCGVQHPAGATPTAADYLLPK